MGVIVKTSVIYQFLDGLPKFRYRLPASEFSGKFLSQKSGAKVKFVRSTFATLLGADFRAFSQ